MTKEKTKLHELLAVEGTRTTAYEKLAAETISKFGKDHYFSGHIKTLEMIADSPENSAIEAAAKEIKELPTTVHETLEYMIDFWVTAEDVIYQKSSTNRNAIANLEFRGSVIAESVPVDYLLGLEKRLEKLRAVFAAMPTLDASKEWDVVNDGRKGKYEASSPDVTSKTEKKMIPIILYEATDKHPAQIEKATKDEVVGTFYRELYSGAATSLQKATSIAVIDDLLAEVKKSRMRANTIEVWDVKIGKQLSDLIMAKFNQV